MPGRAEPRHVRAGIVGPAVVDLLVGDFRDRIRSALRGAVARERRADVADVDLARGERMAVLAQPAVFLALFELAARDAIAGAVVRELLADLPVAHELAGSRITYRFAG